jgi:hypothetical protein
MTVITRFRADGPDNQAPSPPLWSGVESCMREEGKEEKPSKNEEGNEEKSGIYSHKTKTGAQESALGRGASFLTEYAKLVSYTAAPNTRQYRISYRHHHG